MQNSISTMIDVVYWYASSFAGIFTVLLVRWVSRCATLYSRLRYWTLRRFVYPLLKWTGVAYIEAALLGLYVIVNGVCLGVQGRSDLMRRSCRMSSVNTVPLFLGGRMNVLVDAFGISIHNYYLAHHWIGRMAIAQAFLHGCLAISSRKWAFDALTISGLVVSLPLVLQGSSNNAKIALALVLILFTSLSFVRRIAFEWFLWTHTLLAVTVIGGTIWHILPGKFIKLLFPFISILVWSIITLYRLRYHNRGGYISSCNSFPQYGKDGAHTIKLNVRLRRHLPFKPGQFGYLKFPSLRWRYRFQAHPFMIMWCEYDVEVKDDKQIDITNLTFLIQPRGGLTARLDRELQLSDLSKGSSFQWPVSFDGPYGQDLHLEQYETVMLVAQGPGIAGVLRYAQHLAQRSCRDREVKRLLKLESTPNKVDLRKTLHRDATKNVDLFWQLDLNSQEKWISDHLRALQDMDPKRASLHSIPADLS